MVILRLQQATFLVQCLNYNVYNAWIHLGMPGVKRKVHACLLHELGSAGLKQGSYKNYYRRALAVHRNVIVCICGEKCFSRGAFIFILLLHSHLRSHSLVRYIKMKKLIHYNFLYMYILMSLSCVLIWINCPCNTSVFIVINWLLSLT